MYSLFCSRYFWVKGYQLYWYSFLKIIFLFHYLCIFVFVCSVSFVLLWAYHSLVSASLGLSVLSFSWFLAVEAAAGWALLFSSACVGAALNSTYRFWYAVLFFSSSWKYFLVFHLDFFSGPVLFEACYLGSKYVRVFQSSSYWFSIEFYCGQRTNCMYHLNHFKWMGTCSMVQNPVLSPWMFCVPSETVHAVLLLEWLSASVHWVILVERIVLGYTRWLSR